MPGPPRRVVKIIGGVKFTARVRRPELPPSPNDRMHFRVKGGREGVAGSGTRCREGGRHPNLARIRLSAVIYRTRLGHADEDNDRSRLKPAIDGLRDARVIANDTRGFIEHGPGHREKGRSGCC